MKKILALTVIGLVFGACSNDDDGSSIDYSKLTQRWYNVSEKVGGETYLYDDHETCGKDYIEFTADEVAIIGDVVGCSGATAVTETETGTYSRNGNTISLFFGGFSSPGTVKKLTSNSLEVSSVYDFDDDGDDETVISVFTTTP